LTTYLDPSNTPFGTAVILSNLGPESGNAFAAEEGGVGESLDGPFSLTLGVQISHDGANQNTSFDAELNGEVVPEPASVLVWSLLGGLGLVTSGWRAARRYKTRP
jgi:hypothetical protein